MARGEARNRHSLKDPLTMLGACAMLLLGTLGCATSENARQQAIKIGVGVTSIEQTNGSLSASLTGQVVSTGRGGNLQFETDLHYARATGGSDAVAQDDEADWKYSLPLRRAFALGFDGKLERHRPAGPNFRASLGPGISHTTSLQHGRTWTLGTSLREEIIYPGQGEKRLNQTIVMPGSRLTIPLSQHVAFEHDVTLAFPLEAFSDFRLDNEVSLNVAVTKRIAIGLDVDYEYDRNPIGSWNHNKFVTSMTLKFTDVRGPAPATP